MHLLPQMNVMLDFFCIGSVELQGARNKRKLQNVKFLSTFGFELTPSTVPGLRVQRLLQIARPRLLRVKNLKSIICLYVVRSVNKLVLLEHVSDQLGAHCRKSGFLNIMYLGYPAQSQPDLE